MSCLMRGMPGTLKGTNSIAPAAASKPSANSIPAAKGVTASGRGNCTPTFKFANGCHGGHNMSQGLLTLAHLLSMRWQEAQAGHGTLQNSGKASYPTAYPSGTKRSGSHLSKPPAYCAEDVQSAPCTRS